jgi:addiction module RelE/StbE family toxin
VIIRYKKCFEKDFKRLPEHIRERFLERIALFLANKSDRILNNHSVDHVFKDCRSINVTGDYRAIFEDYGDVVVFIAIGTHSELYG